MTRTAAFLVDAMDAPRASWTQDALSRIGTLAALTEPLPSSSSSASAAAEGIHLGLYLVQRSTAAAVSATAGGKAAEVSLARLCRPRLFSLREWQATVASPRAMQAQSAVAQVQDTRRVALCLKSLVALMATDAASPATYRAIHVLAHSFSPTPRLHKILEDAANLNIHICFTALVLPSATAPADEHGSGLDGSTGSGLLQPKIPAAFDGNAATGGHSASADASVGGGGFGVGGGASGLSWRSAGVAVQLDASMAAFMADLAPHENCSVEVCTAEPLMAERQSLVWLQQLLPPQLPRSVLLTIPHRQPQPMLQLQPQPQPQHSLNGPGKPAMLAPDVAHGPQPQQVLCFQLSSELVRFNTGLSRAPLCPCHGLPVERLPMTAGSKGGCPLPSGGPPCCGITHARLDPYGLACDSETVLAGDYGHALKITDRPLPPQPPPPSSSVGRGADSAATFEPFIGEAGHDPSAPCEVDELVLERVVQASSLSESLTYGWPHLLLPSCLEFDSEEEAAANMRAITALCAVLQREGGALLASSSFDLDTGRPTPLARQWYCLVPPAAPQQQQQQQQPSGCCFLAKHIACREQMAPLPPAASNQEASSPQGGRSRAAGPTPAELQAAAQLLAGLTGVLQIRPDLSSRIEPGAAVAGETRLAPLAADGVRDGDDRMGGEDGGDDCQVTVAVLAPQNLMGKGGGNSSGKEAEPAVFGGRGAAETALGSTEEAGRGVMELAPFCPLDLRSGMHERLGAMILRSKKIAPPPPPPPPAPATIAPPQPNPAAVARPPALPAQQQRFQSQQQQQQPTSCPASGAQGVEVGAEPCAVAAAGGRSAAAGAAAVAPVVGVTIPKALQPQQQRPPAAATSKGARGTAAGSGASKAKSQQASRPLWPTLDLRPTGSIAKKRQ